MSTIEEEIVRFAVSAESDDLHVGNVRSALHRLGTPPPGRNEIEQSLYFIARLFERGFIAVDGPFPAGTPWPEQGEAALRRIRREWEALDHAPSFADLCWFRLPQR
jgi:hypothetical protein